MSKPVRILSGGTGLNTVVDPIRLPFDRETGISDLAVAVNVTVDETGFISRRDGFLKVRDEDSHSLFCDGGDCLFISGDTLYRLLPDYSVETVRTGLSQGNRMAYTQVNDDIYYSNGVESGIVRLGGVHEDWKKHGDSAQGAAVCANCSASARLRKRCTARVSVSALAKHGLQCLLSTGFSAC